MRGTVKREICFTILVATSVTFHRLSPLLESLCGCALNSIKGPIVHLRFVTIVTKRRMPIRGELAGNGKSNRSFEIDLSAWNPCIRFF